MAVATGTAILAGAAIAGGVGLLAANQARSASNTAADTAANAQNNATAVAATQYQQQREDFMPFYEAGTAVLPTYNAMNAGTYDWKENPLAKYRTMIEQRASNRFAASRGLLTNKRQANTLAEIEAKNAANGMNDQYNMILNAIKQATGASASMTAASNTNTNAAQTAATNLGNIAMNQGNNQASLYAGIPGALSSYMGLGLNAYNTFKDSPLSTTNKTAPAFYQKEDYEY